MGGFGHGDDATSGDVPPAAEVFVVDGDGSPVAGPPAVGGSGPRTGRRTPMPAAWRVGIVLAAAAIFAFGVVVGRTGLGGTRPAAPRPTVAAPSTVVSTAAVTVTASLAPTTSLAPTESPTAGPALPALAQVGTAAWPEVRGACGASSPAPFVDAVGPQPQPIDAHLVTGGHPTPVDLRDSSVGSALLTPDARHYVGEIATGDGATVLLVGSCDGDLPGRVVRIPDGGRPVDVALPKATAQAQLVGGGDRVWVGISEGGSYSYGPITLIPADGVGRPIALPDGLVPLGGHGRTIVAERFSGGMPTGAISVFDTESRRVTESFGPSGTPAGAVNAILGGEYVVTAPWVCTDRGRCEIHRYDIATGRQHVVTLQRPADRILASGGAVSPDGATVAIPLYWQPPAPAPYRPAAPSASSTSGTTRIGLLNLGNGSVRALPGLTLGPTAAVALAYTPEGRWLIVAVDAGDSTRMLLYTASGDGPYLGVGVPGRVALPVMSRVSSRG